MDGLSARLRSLAASDAARTDPAEAIVERGWQRVSAAIATPALAGAGTATTAAAATATKKVLGALAIAVLGLGGAASIAAPVDVAIARPEIAVRPTAQEPEIVETPRQTAAEPSAIEAPMVTVEPDPPVVPTPAPSVRARTRATPDTLADQVRALGIARRELDRGRPRAALKTARKLLRDPESQVAPEARAIEAIAACGLGLREGDALADAFARRHPSSPLRGRVAKECGRSR